LPFLVCSDDIIENEIAAPQKIIKVTTTKGKMSQIKLTSFNTPTQIHSIKSK